MPIKKLRQYLDAQGVKYITISHSPAYTAQMIAAAAHLPGQEVAKTVMVKLDSRMVMVVLPAPYKVDFHLLEEATGAMTVTLALESEFRKLFPECELGAMPPFGNLYGLEVFVAKKLTEDTQIAFNAGSHTELMQLAYADFERLVEPRILEVAALV